MKRCLIVIGLALSLNAAAFGREQSMLARVTVYWASGGSGSDQWTRNHQAATRVRLRAGHCAVDPRRIPYGSKVLLPDRTLIAVDTGKHVRTRRAARLCGRSSAERNAIVIDRFFETKAQALAWSSKHPHFMTVRVFAPNEEIQSTSVSAKTLVATSSTTQVTVSNSAPRRTPYFPPTVTTSSLTVVASAAQDPRRILTLPKRG